MKYLNRLVRTLLPIGLMRFNITEEEQAEADLLQEMSSGDGEQVGGGAGDRLKKLNAIGQRADEERADQFADVHDDDSTTKFVANRLDEAGEPIVDEAAAAKAAAAAAESEADAARAAAAAAAENDPPKRKLKINGVEKEFTEEELVALAQKGASADDKFQEAARLRAEAENLAAKSTTRATDVPADDNEELLALARALQVGTDEEAVAALRKLKGPSSPPGITPDGIYQAIDAKLAFNEANRIFETEYADLVKDPRIERMIMDKDNELVKAGDKRPYLVRYREIGDDVRGWLKSISPAPASAPVDPLVEKAARKAAAPAAPPTAGGKAAPTQTEEEPEESVQDVIAQMRKQRGGPQWARS